MSEGINLYTFKHHDVGTIKRAFLLFAGLSLTLSGCSSTEADDASGAPVLSFNESIPVGDPEGHPADQYLESDSRRDGVSKLDGGSPGGGGS